MGLDDFPRVDLAHLPTPLEHLPMLSKRLGGPNLWVKRDDCTGLATGGNKTRKLEFLIGDALRRKADVLVTHGAWQSNHVRQTAAAAARCGLGCEVLLEQRLPRPSDEYQVSGNVLLDRLFGARVHAVPAGTEVAAATASLVEELRRRGRSPYIIPGGGSNPIGALGYVRGARELIGQARHSNIALDHIIVASGTAGTQAGLLAGLQMCRYRASVLGIAVGERETVQQRKVQALLCRTVDLLQLSPPAAEAAQVNADYIGEGYGIPTTAMRDAVALLAGTEGILLDPVYTGKAMAGLLDLTRRQWFRQGDNVVFVHTGGTTALFAYCNAFY